MTWKKFSEEKPEDGILINARRPTLLSYAYVVASVDNEKIVNQQTLKEIEIEKDDEWQEVEE